jgi:DNA-binding SARP family transcriptional activator
MENNSKTRACTTYHKDFTPEEKVKYNEYIKQRMRVYHASEKGRKARAAYYQLKKARKQEQQGVIMSAA